MSTETQTQAHADKDFDLVPYRLAERFRGVPEVTVWDSPHYHVNYGVRTDDKAVVIHLYAPGYDYDYLCRLGKVRPEDVLSVEMLNGIAIGIVQHLKSRNIPYVAHYNEELESVSLVIPGYGASLLWEELVVRLLESLAPADTDALNAVNV